ncbi:carboxymuconolactone decarboxylase family protein [Diaminobutyricibacter tongyongensis]|uniref:Carboxymuconolactone decarboxylase family protein n=1 Tax=Leifsonia tongyongensis TaxID=1268043 RepID=A0A6L9Y2B8_9MICO|nr:carboxymuconolactone decarboxylase family protein [Diaminobutyricibacter tongyongensis]NEN07832.1 carboxymuconolactone decarboxylase family protein [Diaminobutyricibacter tongyongensis]
MSRLTVPTRADVPNGTQGILDGIQKQLGFAPSMFSTIAANPAVLEIVMGLQGSISRLLDAKTRHTIALAVSESNGCGYCLAMHSYVSSELGSMSSDDIELARAGSSTDPRRAAVARFVQKVVDNRGQVADSDIAAVRGAGYSDAEILAIVTIAVVFLLTNYINNVNQTVVDVPATTGQAA